MKKYLMLAAVLVGQLFAMEEAPAIVESVKQFTGTDGQLHTVQFANEAEIDALNDPSNPTRITINGKNLHRPRVSANQVRVAIIDNDPTKFMFAGRMVYGVQPGMDDRLAVILDFYSNFATHCGFLDLTHEKHVTEAGLETSWVSPVHAATAILESSLHVNTFSFYEAMAALIKESHADLAAHPVIPSINKPFFLMVYSEIEPTGDMSNKVISIKLPIDGEFKENGEIKENRGWKWVILARIDGEDIPALPAALTEPIDIYNFARLSV